MAPNQRELLNKIIFGGFGLLLATVSYFLMARDGEVTRKLENSGSVERQLELKLERLEGEMQRHNQWLQWLKEEISKCQRRGA